MTTATDPRLRGPHTEDGRRILAFCPWLVERGDTLIDNYGGEWRALSRARYAKIGGQRVNAILCCPADRPGDGAICRSDAGWDLKPVDDFRFGRRIEKSDG